MRVVWSESDRQFQEILNSEGISGKSVSDWRENCKCGGKLSTHFSLIRIKKQMFASLTFHIEMLKNWKSSIAHFDFHRFSNFFFLLAASHLQFSFLCFRRRWFPIAALSVFPPAHNHEIAKASNFKRFLSSLHIGAHCTEIKMENIFRVAFYCWLRERYDIVEKIKAFKFGCGYDFLCCALWR